jgi:hypothetical protein
MCGSVSCLSINHVVLYVRYLDTIRQHAVGSGTPSSVVPSGSTPPRRKMRQNCSINPTLQWRSKQTRLECRDRSDNSMKLDSSRTSCESDGGAKLRADLPMRLKQGASNRMANRLLRELYFEQHDHVKFRNGIGRPRTTTRTRTEDLFNVRIPSQLIVKITKPHMN